MSMDKRGRVEVGKTPSVKSGKVSSKIEHGEALAEGEKLKQSYDKKLLNKLPTTNEDK